MTTRPGVSSYADMDPAILHPPSPPSPKPISSVQATPSNDLSLLDLSSQHKSAETTAFASLASSLGTAKHSFLKWRGNSFSHQQRPNSFFDSSSANSSFSDTDILQTRIEAPSSLPPSGIYSLLTRSTSAVGQGFRSLTRRSSQQEEQVSTTSTIVEDDMGFMFEAPPLDPVKLLGYSASTHTRLLKSVIAEEIRMLVPARVQLHDTWTLVYSLEQHGASLSTLYSNNVPKSDTRPGFVLVIRDRTGAIFGAYVNEHFRPSELKRFFGNGDCFLWKFNGDVHSASDARASHPGSRSMTPITETSVLRAFPYTGANDFVIFCTQGFLSMGGGDGHYGLWVDSNLERGVSSPSLTFDNEPLCGSGTKFDIIGLEVWRIG